MIRKVFCMVSFVTLAGVLTVGIGCSRERCPAYRRLQLTSVARSLTPSEQDAIAALRIMPGYLQDAVAADLDGDGRDEIVVLAKEGDLTFVGEEQPASGIVRIEPEGLRYLCRFPVAYVNVDPMVADLDRDGLPDLIFMSDSGGNAFGSSSWYVVRWDGRAFHQQDIGEWKAAYDLDADGTVEIETTFAMADAGRCALDCDVAMVGVREIQYVPSALWGWRDGSLTNISAEVPAFYRDVRLPALVAMREELTAILTDCESAECAEAGSCLLECLKIVEARARRLAGDGRAD